MSLPPQSKWQRFEAWSYSWAPGFKTKIVTSLGALSSLAAMLQQYVSGLPLDQFISASKLALITAILFTLAFWFHGMGDRVVDAS